MRITTVFQRLLRGQGFRVREVRLEGGQVEMVGGPAHRIPRCSGCHRKCHHVHDRKRRRWRDLNMLDTKAFLVGEVRRVRCPRCGVRAEELPWARTGSVYTRRFEDRVGWLTQQASQTCVARLFDISWVTVGKIAGRIVREKLDPGRFDGLKRIGVDEISYRRHHKYLTTVVNHDTSAVIHAGKGKSGEALAAFFRLLGPERAALFDLFHVVKLAHKAVDEVRRDLMRRLTGRERTGLKKTRFVLLKNPWNLKPEEKERLSGVERTNKTLYRAYLLKEELQRCMEYKSEGWARKMLKRWLRWALLSRLKPFRRLAMTVKEHFEGVLGYVRHGGLNNGRLEGMNNKVRLLSHRAYGFHSDTPLINMIYLCCGGIRLELPHTI
jgi:transposase